MRTPNVWPDFTPYQQDPRLSGRRVSLVTVPQESCHPAKPPQLETGQFLIHKKKSWKGLSMAAFMAVHHKTFMGEYIYGDCMTFYFGFEATSTPYAVVEHLAIVVGRVTANPSTGGQSFYGITMGQRHPDHADRIAFLHRGLVKFDSPHFYTVPDPYAWHHTCTASDLEPWYPIPWHEIPENIRFHNDLQGMAWQPVMESRTTFAPVSKDLHELEGACLGYLMELVTVPLFPANPPVDCVDNVVPAKRFFCDHK